MRIKRLRRIVSFLLIFVLFGNLGLGSWVQASENSEVESEEIIKGSEEIDTSLPIGEEVGGGEEQDEQEQDDQEEDDQEEDDQELEEDGDSPLGDLEPRILMMDDEADLTYNIEDMYELEAALSFINDNQGDIIIDLQGETIYDFSSDGEWAPNEETMEKTLGLLLEINEDQSLTIQNGTIAGKGGDNPHEIFYISDDNKGKIHFKDLEFTNKKGKFLKVGKEKSQEDQEDMGVNPGSHSQTIYFENVTLKNNEYSKYDDYLIESNVGLNIISSDKSNLNISNNKGPLIKAMGKLVLSGFDNININENTLSGSSGGNQQNLIYLNKDFIIEETNNLNIEKNYIDEDNGAGLDYKIIDTIGSEQSINLELSGDINLEENKSDLELVDSKNLTIQAKNLNIKKNNNLNLGAEQLGEITIEEDINIFGNGPYISFFISSGELKLYVGGSINHIGNWLDDPESLIRSNKIEIDVGGNINSIGNTGRNIIGFISSGEKLDLEVDGNFNLIGNMSQQGPAITMTPKDEGDNNNNITIRGSFNLIKNGVIWSNLLAIINGSEEDYSNLLRINLNKINIIGNAMEEIEDWNDDGGIYTSNNKDISNYIKELNLYDFTNKKYASDTHKKALFLGNSVDLDDPDYKDPLIHLNLEGEEYEYPNMQGTELKFILNGGQILSDNLGPQQLTNLTIDLTNEDIIKVSARDGLSIKDFIKPGYELEKIQLNGVVLTGYTSKELAEKLTKEIEGLELIRGFNNIEYVKKIKYDEDNDNDRDLKIFIDSLQGDIEKLKCLEAFSLDILNQAMDMENSTLEFIWKETKAVEETPGENPGGGGGSGGGGGKDKPSEPGLKEPEVKEPVDSGEPTKPVSPEDKDNLEDYKKGDRSKRDSLLGMILEPKIEYELNKVDHLAYLKGYKDQSIKPDGKLTRAEAAMVFYRLMEEEFRQSVQTQEHNFKDVEDGKWYTRAVASLAKAGMVSGYKDGTFKPGQQITRAELASMIAKLTDTAIHPTEFKDIVEHWAEDYINSAQKAGWLKGYEDGSFKPNDLISRSEFATITNSILDRKVLRENILPGIKNFKDLKDTSWYYEIMVEAANGHKYEIVDGVEIWKELDKREFE